MLVGILLILAGVLLVIYPPLLAVIVAAVLIFSGSVLVAVAWHYRKHRRHFDNPTVEFIIRT